MHIWRIVFVSVFAVLLNTACVSAASPPRQGSVLPDIDLTVPKDPVHKGYLGLAGEGLFKIPDIRAEVVIIEIFSMYCPHCQREAPRVNELYQNIEKSPEAKGRVKLIGIGAGNSAFEVDVFRKNYEVPFPLFPDGDFSIHKKIGEVRTPYFIAVRIKDDGTHSVFYSELGGFDKATDFLQLMLKSAGLK